MERRSEESGFGFGFGFGGGPLGTSDLVPSYIAENASGVVACINAISSGLASLPIRTYRRLPGGGRIELTDRDHWLPALLRRPGPNITWPELCEHLLASAALVGNGIALIFYDDDGLPRELYPVPWFCCTPVLIEARKLAFDVSLTFGPFAGPGIFKRYLATECILLKDRSDNGGWTGRSRISRSPAVISAALSIGEYSASVWKNSANPSGVISHPGKLNSDAKAYLLEQFNSRYAGTLRAKGTLLVDEGMTWTAAHTSPVDAEVLESRKFTIAEICRIYSVPPAIVQSLEMNAFSSAEQANKWFAQITLSPWAKKLEQVLEKSLLGDEPDIHVEIDFSGLLRGQYSERWSAYATAIQNKILSVSEIRDIEGFSPIPQPGELVPGGLPP